MELVVTAVSAAIDSFAWEIAANYAISTVTFDLIVTAGAALATMAVSYATNYLVRSLFGGSGENIYGPRLSDLIVQTSTDGAPIPLLYGSMRMSGNVIWTTDLKEIETTTTTSSSGGGSGDSGGSSSVTTYNYTTDVAIALCEGPIVGIKKVWADSKLVYDVSEYKGSVDSALTASSLVKSFNVYLGTETQEPDPVIEAIQGVGNVPAYRGVAYVVAETLQLEDFGNRLPNFTFEVVASGNIDPTFVNVDTTTLDTEGPIEFLCGITFAKRGSELVGTSLHRPNDGTKDLYLSKYIYNSDILTRVSRDLVTNDFRIPDPGDEQQQIFGYVRRANYDEEGMVVRDRYDYVDNAVYGPVYGEYYYGNFNGVKSKILLNDYNVDLVIKDYILAKYKNKFVWTSSPVTYSIGSKDVQIVTYNMPYRTIELPAYSENYVTNIALSSEYIHLTVTDKVNAHYLLRMDYNGTVTHYIQLASADLVNGFFNAIDNNTVLIGSSPLKQYKYSTNSFKNLFNITMNAIGGLNQWDKPFKYSDSLYLVGSGEALPYLNPTGFVKGITFANNILHSTNEPLVNVLEDVLDRIMDTPPYELVGLDSDSVRGYAIKGLMSVKEAINGLAIAHQFSIVEEDGKLIFYKNIIANPIDSISREYLGSIEI